MDDISPRWETTLSLKPFNEGCHGYEADGSPGIEDNPKWVLHFRTHNCRTNRTNHRCLWAEQSLDCARLWSVEFDIPRSTCHRIITKKLKMVEKSKEWVPHGLTTVQWKKRVVYCEQNRSAYSATKNLQRPVEYNVAHNVIDETWDLESPGWEGAS